MSAIVLDRDVSDLLRRIASGEHAQAEGEFDPIPMCAPSEDGFSAVLPYQLMLPAGSRCWKAHFHFDTRAYVKGCLVRFADIPPRFCRWSHGYTTHIEPDDTMTVHFWEAAP